MKRLLGQVALVVREYAEAIHYYVKTLGFHLVEDTALENGKRWVVVSPTPESSTRLLLAKAVGPQQIARIGDQTGGRVFLFLYTDDFKRDYDAYRERGVVFEELPRDEPFGKVVVFRDLYGNKWDLIQSKAVPFE